MRRLREDEVMQEMKVVNVTDDKIIKNRTISLATGVMAYPYINELVDKVVKDFPNINLNGVKSLEMSAGKLERIPKELHSKNMGYIVIRGDAFDRKSLNFTKLKEQFPMLKVLEITQQKSFLHKIFSIIKSSLAKYLLN